jgi:hypothetical protein
MDLGRAESIDTLVRHHEAVEQRLSFSLRQAELIDGALAEFDHQVADVAEGGPDHALTASVRVSVRALLVVAAGEDGYDATLVPDRGHLAVRVRNTLFGLRVEVVDGAAALPSHASRVVQSAPQGTPLRARPDPPSRLPEPDSGPVPG